MFLKKKKEAPIFHTNSIEIVTLPPAMVAVFDRTSGEPEQETGELAKQWLADRGLAPDAARLLGFDNYGEEEMRRGLRRYVQYLLVPPEICVDGEDNVKPFGFGRYARLMIENPFAGDFPLGWEMLLKWARKHGYEDDGVTCRKGVNGRCWKSSDKKCKGRCWASSEAAPCFEEIVTRDGVQYMDFYLPIK